MTLALPAVGKISLYSYTQKPKKSTRWLVPKESQVPGYTGFECYFAPDVSLEEDLMHRDQSTINAIAQDDKASFTILIMAKEDHLLLVLLPDVSDALLKILFVCCVWLASRKTPSPQLCSCT